MSILFDILLCAVILILIVAIVRQKKKYWKLLRSYRGIADKNLDIFLLFNQWLEMKQKRVNLSDYFYKNEYKAIAIYGMGIVGQRLKDELSDTGVEIKYVIDKNASYVHSELKVYRPEEDLPMVDAIIVTPISYFDSIREQLSPKIACPIISAEDLTYEIWCNMR